MIFYHVAVDFLYNGYMIKKITSWWAYMVLALICITSFSLMLHASRTDSAIDDELAHIPAGYGYIHNLDYRLNPEHPPLLKALATAPLLFLDPIFPTQNAAWTTAVNGQWDMGREFFYESGNDANVKLKLFSVPNVKSGVLSAIN